MIATEPDSDKGTERRQVNVAIDPAVAVGGVPSPTVPIQFRIRPKASGRIFTTSLYLTFTNTDGANPVTLGIAPMLINRIDFIMNGGSTPSEQMNGEHIFAMMSNLTTEQILNFNIDNGLNMNSSTFVGPTAIAAGTSATYVIPIMDGVLTGCDPRLFFQDFIVNVYLNAPVVSGTGTYVLSAARLLLKASQRNDDSKELPLYSKFPYYDVRPRFQAASFPATMQAAQVSLFPLTALNMNVSGLLIVVRASKTMTGSGLYTFARIGGTQEANGLIDIQDTSRKSLIGGQITAQQLRNVAGTNFNGAMTASHAVYPVSFATNPVTAQVRGMNSGYQTFTGSENLYITPGAGFTTGTYTVDIYAWGYAATAWVSGVGPQPLF